MTRERGEAMVISHASWKGGTGKTTLTAMTAKLLAERGRRVLLIDLDSQCALSQIYGGWGKGAETSLKFLTVGMTDFGAPLRAAEGIDLIPSDLRISKLSNIMDKQLRVNLKRSGYLGMYDYILIDPPGTYGAHMRNAVEAAHVVVVPGMASRIDFEATRLCMEEMEMMGLDAEVFVVVNGASGRLPPMILERFREEFGEFLLSEPVPQMMSLRRMADSLEYNFTPAVKDRLERYVDRIASGKEAEYGEV